MHEECPLADKIASTNFLIEQDRRSQAKEERLRHAEAMTGSSDWEPTAREIGGRLVPREATLDQLVESEVNVGKCSRCSGAVPDFRKCLLRCGESKDAFILNSISKIVIVK